MNLTELIKKVHKGVLSKNLEALVDKDVKDLLEALNKYEERTFYDEIQ